MEGNTCRWLGSQRTCSHQALCCEYTDPGHLLHSSSSPKSVGSSEGLGVQRDEVGCGVGWEEGLACRACAQATTGPKAHGIPSSSSNAGRGRGCRMSPHPCSPPRVTEPPVYGGAPSHPGKDHTSQPPLQLPMSRSDRHHFLVVVFRRSCHTTPPTPSASSHCWEYRRSCSI